MSGGVSTWRLFSRPEPGKKLGPGFEVVLCFACLGIYMGYGDLRGIRENEVYTTASKLDFLLMAVPGVYGLRIAQFIAIARRYRMPQYLEWLVFVVPVLAIAVCAVGSPYFVKMYAEAYGYQFCSPRPDHPLVYVFSKAAQNCPWVPYGKR